MDTTVNVTLTGAIVSDGTIELRRLVQFGDRLQKAVDRMAYAIEKREGSRRKLTEVRTDTTLRLVDTKEGSFIMELDFARPPILLEGYYDVATTAITKLIAGIEYLRNSNNGRLPDGYDQGVLVVLQDLGRLLNQGLDSMEFEVRTSEKNLYAVYDKYTQSRVEEYIDEPEEKIAAITGSLLMANFRKDKYRCHLVLDDDSFISCTFDEDVADEVTNAMRHLVNVIGIATINPVDDEISQFHIKQIVVLDNEKVSSGYLAELLDAYIKENDTATSFRQGWQEAMTGETVSLSELWDGIDAE